MSNSQTGRISTTGSFTSSAFEVIACGALAAHIREIAARRGWPVIVRPLPARLHNRPEKIHQHSERIVATAQANGSRAVLAYADCGTYGALDKVCDARGVKRLPGLHCYDLYAGPDHRVVEMTYHRAVPAPKLPNLVNAKWEGYKKAGPLLFATEHHGTADGNPFELTFTDVAVKLKGSKDWINAQ